jgi:hypothetical protein
MSINELKKGQETGVNGLKIEEEGFFLPANLFC